MVYLASSIIVFLFLGWLGNAIVSPFFQASAQRRQQEYYRWKRERWRYAFWQVHGREPGDFDWQQHLQHEELEQATHEYMGPDPTLVPRAPKNPYL